MSEGYANSDERADIPHPTAKIKPGAVVEFHESGLQAKVLKVDYMTCQFTVHGGTRTEAYAFHQARVVDGAVEPVNTSDPAVKIAEMEKRIAKLKAEQAEAQATLDAENAPTVPQPKAKK
jgi:uncharacterized protein YceH (UPF0502 family)